jgi:hypothetical protein
MQLLVGVVHVVFGLWLFTASPTGYSVYTIAFGGLTAVFAWGLWSCTSWGWTGTIAVVGFVIAADALTLLNLPSVPGIPKLAGYGEIPYSTIILLYLGQKRIRKQFKIK